MGSRPEKVGCEGPKDTSFNYLDDNDMTELSSTDQLSGATTEITRTSLDDQLSGETIELTNDTDIVGSRKTKEINPETDNEEIQSMPVPESIYQRRLQNRMRNDRLITILIYIIVPTLQE